MILYTSYMRANIRVRYHWVQHIYLHLASVLIFMCIGVALYKVGRDKIPAYK